MYQFTVAVPKNRKFTHGDSVLSVNYEAGEVAVFTADCPWWEPVFCDENAVQGILTAVFVKASRMIEAGLDPLDFDFRWTGREVEAFRP